MPLALSCAVDWAPTYSVLGAELQVVAAALARDEPRHRVVNLIRVVDARLRYVALLIDERQIVQLRLERRLVLAVAVEAGVGEGDVLLREVDAERVEAIVPHHRVERGDDGLIDVVLLTGCVFRHWQRRLSGDDHHRNDLIHLRRGLAQPSHGPRVVGVQLVIEAGQRIPHPILCHRRTVELGVRRDGDAGGAVDHHTLDVDEEVGLVLDDGATDIRAVGLQLRVGLDQVVLLDEEVLLRQARVLPESSADAVKDVAAGLS